MLSTWPESCKDVRQAPPSGFQSVLTQCYFYYTTPSIDSSYWLILPSVAPVPFPRGWLCSRNHWDERVLGDGGAGREFPLILLMVKRNKKIELREMKRSFEKNKISIPIMLFSTPGNFNCPTELSRTQSLANSHVEHSRIYWATITGPQVLFQSEDQELVLEKPFLPTSFPVFYGWTTGLSSLANWGETRTLPQGEQTQLKENSETAFHTTSFTFHFSFPFLHSLFHLGRKLIFKTPNPLSVRGSGWID